MATLNYLGNKKSTVIIHGTANGTVVVAGNITVSNVTYSASDVLTGGNISRIWFGSSPSGYWNIKRGANLVWSATGSGTQLFDGAPLTVDRTANVVIELVGSTNGHIMIELRKEGIGTGTP